MNNNSYLKRKRHTALYSGYDREIQFHAVLKMGVGPPEPPCRGRFQTTICCCFTMEMVVSNVGKGSTRLSQVSAMETNKTEPLLTCRKFGDVIKTGITMLSRDESGRANLGKRYIKHLMWFSLNQSNLFTVQTVTGMKEAPTWHRLQYGTWEPVYRCKGRNPRGRTARIRIPMRYTGAEQFVVVVKSRNGDGAKGLYYPVPFRNQPKGRSS